jgi:hypothetical protein
MPDHFHCCDEVDADEAYRRGLAEGMAAGIREPCGHGSDSPIAGCNDPRHDEIEAWYRQALEAGAAPRAEGLERTTENSEPICDIPWLTGPPNAMCLKCGHPFRAHRTEAAQGAAPRAEGLAEHITDFLDPLACWCGPYRDNDEPEVIIHRKEGAP